ncbi:hypothetical protein MFLO_00655 [Listeria floridensis FSL S10-1187]|uniref:XcbB/CpsF family capsular polysaccharide biosynthesis protein n=1 Tax=Listeria floridensis FSL S10-1187 TaxID=1265817 RepID=A0ABN0RIB2_9LIST|nr:XcbB/CpsF family capsular polysaccharide biosynthesis protein [Listeria floridensis]EUJ33709.1 hypothetical protein MFLO_00655 [Listeria floridensis FSL S10-1187]
MEHPELEFSDIYSFQPKFDRTKLMVKTFSDRNLIDLARENTQLMEMYVSILAKDYMLYMHTNQASYFIRRKNIHTIWQRKDLIQYNDLFYSLTDVPVEKRNPLAPKRLIVIFSPMPPIEKYSSANLGERCFVPSFPSIQKHLLKDTMVMRIMDLNLSHGSHYINSTTYPTMESDIQGAIQNVIANHEIHKDDVVLYGGSKGGTGALYHSLLGNYHSVSVDPIISLQQYNEENDLHFLKNFRQTNLLNRMQALVKKDDLRKQYILGTPTVPFNYDLYKQLASPSIEIIDIFDSAIKKHADISKNSVVEQVTYMNEIFLSSENYKKELEQLREIAG